ncbi:MAG: methyltransferase domain-containing protein [Dehalococcoidia bacterium]|nr:methyltransferase domain-containing protein [Dehalococcoidia bacterium]
MAEGALDGVDVNWGTEELFLGELGPDSFFLFGHMLSATLDEVASRDEIGPWFGGRVLDVACGAGGDVAQLISSGWEAHGLEPSKRMLDLARERNGGTEEKTLLARGIAEALPYRDASFDRVMCKGSFDHFADPQLALAEIRRVLRPNGRLVVSIANFDALSCRLGKALKPILRVTNADFNDGSRPYWRIPADHTFEGNLRTVLSLGRQTFALERYYGVSLMWSFPWWVWMLKHAPSRLSSISLRLANRLGRQHPSMADVIVVSWRKR